MRARAVAIRLPPDAEHAVVLLGTIARTALRYRRPHSLQLGPQLQLVSQPFIPLSQVEAEYSFPLILEQRSGFLAPCPGSLSILRGIPVLRQRSAPCFKSAVATAVESRTGGEPARRSSLFPKTPAQEQGRRRADGPGNAEFLQSRHSATARELRNQEWCGGQLGGEAPVLRVPRGQAFCYRFRPVLAD